MQHISAKSPRHGAGRNAIVLSSLCWLAAAALTACGGGGAASVAGASASPNAMGPNGQASVQALAVSGPLGASPLPADLSATPSFHMAAVTPGVLPFQDQGGTNASARLSPRRFALTAEALRIRTAGLTPESLAAQVSAMPSRAMAAAAPMAAATPAATPAATATPMVAGYTPAQVRAAYGLPALPVTGATLSAADAVALGAGQTIYIVDAYHAPNALADLNNFSQQFGVPTCAALSIAPTAAMPLAAPASTCQFAVVYATSAGTMSTAAPAYNSSWAYETSLDVQWAHAIAPLSRIVLIEAPTSGLSDLGGAVLVANKMGPGPVSMSFGAGEGSYVPATNAYYFSAPGMTYLAATGDSGAQVNWPAVSTNVVAVGGTTLSYSGTGTRSETAWSGTGGGISLFEALPSYQSGVSIPGRGLLGNRAVADVAFNADPNTGQFVVVTPPGGTPATGIVGGTSLATPQWAGVIALANAARVANGQAVLGDPHATLYNQVAKVPGNYAAAFQDVKVGSNGTCITCASATGYDQTTGWGTPNVSSLIALLKGVALPPLPAPSMPSGMAGVAYSLKWAATDVSGGALTYTLANAPSGLTVSAAGQVSWAAPVAGTYTFGVTVKNTSGQTATGTETLTVVPAIAAPVITGGTWVVKTGAAYSQTLSVSAPANSGTLTYALAGAPTGLAISSTGTLSWAKAVQGSYTFTASVSNVYGKTGSASITLNVIAQTAPLFSGATVFTGVAGTAFSGKVTASNPNNSTLAYTLTGAPAGMTIAADGTLSWANPVKGNYGLAIRVADSYAYATTGSFTVSIYGLPTLAGGALTGNTTAAFAAKVTALDPNGSALSYTMAGAPAGLTLSTAGALAWPSPVKGVYPLVVTAKDALGLSVTATYTLTVYGAPVLTGGSFTGNTTVALAAMVVGTDPNGSALSYTVTGGPIGLTLSTAGALAWPKPVQGVYALAVTAKDALGVSTTATYTLTVYGAPAMTAAALKATTTTAFSATVVAKDPNASALTYTVTGAPVGLTINASTGAMAWAKPVKGSYTLVVTAKNALGVSTTTSFTLTVA